MVFETGRSQGFYKKGDKPEIFMAGGVAGAATSTLPDSKDYQKAWERSTWGRISSPDKTSDINKANLKQPARTEDRKVNIFKIYLKT